MRVVEAFRSLEGILPGYEPRPGQLAMAEAVEAALEEARPLFVEAGTGTGKTFAYLLAAALSGRKVVVSTATRALQDQIVQRDLPLLARALPNVRFDAVMMKGLSNYVCLRRLHEARSAGVPEPMLDRVAAWAQTTASGDRSELASVPDDAEVWRRVASSSETRIGAGCPFFERCAVTRMRRDAERAELLVVNHHLFCADLALRRARGSRASVLPPFDAVIFDEAHQLEEIASSFFGTRVSSGRVESLTRDARRTLLAEGWADRGGAVRVMLAGVDDCSADLFGSLVSGGSPRGERRAFALVNDRELGTRFARLDTSLEAVEAWMGENAGASEALLHVARRVRELRDDLERVREPVEPDSGTVTWIETRERSAVVGSSTLDVGAVLREHLFDRVGSVVLTSATLATPGPGGASFHFARARLGAPPDTTELVVPSPFDYERKVALYVATDLPEPGAPDYERAAVERAAALIRMTGGGAFVLATSLRMMHALRRGLSERIDHLLLTQGDAPKHALLARFREAGDAVLCATMSFWEGVDVPGRALRLVILDKIPFAVPTDPVTVARGAQIENAGGNPFSQYTVPAAAITMKQGFGRLVRTSEDGGVVAVLDPRLVRRGYGRQLLAALPPARRVSSLEDLEQFWAESAP